MFLSKFSIIYNYYHRHIFTIFFFTSKAISPTKLLHFADTVSPFCSYLRNNVLMCTFLYFSCPLFSLLELDAVLLA